MHSAAPSRNYGRITRYILILALGIFVGAGIILERAVQARREPQTDPDQALPVEELRVFTEVFSRIKSDYVETVDDKNSCKTPSRACSPVSIYLELSRSGRL